MVVPNYAGYFTSRPSTKLYSRLASGYVRAARQLEVVQGWDSRMGHNTDRAAKTVALLQHHDAITGTDRFHVNKDYRLLLSKGAYTQPGMSHRQGCALPGAQMAHTDAFRSSAVMWRGMASSSN